MILRSAQELGCQILHSGDLDALSAIRAARDASVI
jgi:hypothetical protein